MSVPSIPMIPDSGGEIHVPQVVLRKGKKKRQLRTLSTESKVLVLGEREGEGGANNPIQCLAIHDISTHGGHCHERNIESRIWYSYAPFHGGEGRHRIQQSFFVPYPTDNSLVSPPQPVMEGLVGMEG